MSEELANDLCNSARMKTIILQEQISKKVLIDKASYLKLQEDLNKCYQRIDKLCNDRQKLQNALSKAISKRDSHYQQYMHYKHQYESLKPETIKPAADMSPNLSLKLELQSAKQQINIRDKKIKELYSEISALDSKLNSKDAEKNSWKDLYSASKYISEETSNNSDEIITSSRRVLKKLKLDRVLYQSFKEVAGCSRYFIELVERKQWEEALLKIIGYVELLLANFKIESLNMRTPSFSPYVHFKGLNNEEGGLSPYNKSKGLEKEENECNRHIKIMSMGSDESERFSPQVSVINPEISGIKDISYQSSSKQNYNPKFNRLFKPKVTRNIKFETSKHDG